MNRNRATYKTFIMLVPIIVLLVFLIMASNMSFSPSTTGEVNNPKPWPPIVGQPYPDLELIDQEGVSFKLSYLKGKVIIVEPIGMTCAACQAYSGGHEYGAYQNNPVESYSKSFRKIFPKYAKGLRLPSKDIVFIQIILYDMKLGKPTKEDARKWAEHFNISKNDNHFVTIFPYDMRSRASFNMIPGFQLIGRDFILRADATGHNPPHNLYTQLIPMTLKLVKKK